VDKDQLREEDWITPIAQEFATKEIDEEIAHHPELAQERDRLIEQHVLKNRESIEKRYGEFYQDNVEGMGAISEALQNETDDVRESVQKEFKRASEIFLSNQEAAPTEKGQEILQTALGISSQTMAWLYFLAFDLQKKGESFKSIGVFRFITMLNPVVPEFWIGLGLAVLNLEKVEEAKVHLEMALKLDPDNATALYFLAHCCKMEKEFKEGLEYCEKAEKAAAKDPSNQELIQSIKELKETLIK
jgi:tetratricopeptide (TPR) repeat protein